MKKNNRIIVILTLFMLFFYNLSMGEKVVLTGEQAEQKVKGAELIRWNETHQTFDFIKFKQGEEIVFTDLTSTLKQLLQLDEFLDLTETQRFDDQIGFTHIRFALSYNHIPFYTAMIIAHTKQGKLSSLNGEYYIPDGLSVKPTINEVNALQLALKQLKAKTYKWQIPSEEAHLKEIENNPETSYYPKAELCYIAKDNLTESKDFRLVYRFNIYAHEPLARQNIFIDALSGETIFKEDLIQHIDRKGKARTRYSDTVELITDSFAASNPFYRLRETGRGGGVFTYDLKKGTNYGSAADFTDNDNFWNNWNTNKDEVAGDAHFGTEKTYDYFKLIHNWKSYNNQDAPLRSYIHYSSNFVNAFWDGQRMTYGDGNSTYQPLTSLDVCGHEVSHGVTGNSAKLIYSYESGALNESFSDIFGTAIEFYAAPKKGDYMIGEDFSPGGNGFRNMANPNSKNHPACYKGQHWYTGSGDNGGVHYNSGVQNFWFYLLSEGGKGTNCNSKVYDVKGIGMKKAEKIAFRNLSVYLTQNSKYADAAFYAEQAALDIFGSCSQELINTVNAWYACGVLNNPYDTSLKAFKVDFRANTTTDCIAPFNFQFLNKSIGAKNFEWFFGDGDTSKKINPFHTYQNAGVYTVKLRAQSCFGGLKDSITKIRYISADPNAGICKAVFMPTAKNTGATQKGCSGVLFDSGADSFYQNNTHSKMLIAPQNASGLLIEFKDFDFEQNRDGLLLYAKHGKQFKHLGFFTGNALRGKQLTIRYPSLFIEQYSDIHGGTAQGFEMIWKCIPRGYNNASVLEVLSPMTGTNETNSALDYNTKISVIIRNDGYNPLLDIPVNYRIDKGAIIRDTLKGFLDSFKTASFSFKQPLGNLSVGKHTLEVWTSYANDTLSIFDTLVTEFERKAHPALTLPWMLNFENIPTQTYTDSIANFIGIPNAYFENNSAFAERGRVRVTDNIMFVKNGNKALIIDACVPQSYQVSPTPLRDGKWILNTNLDNYKTSKYDVNLSFTIGNFGVSSASPFTVYLRGNKNNPWVAVYSYNLNEYGKFITPIINLTQKLASFGQQLSASTQVAFGLDRTEPIEDGDILGLGHGISLDDIKIYQETTNDADIAIGTYQGKTIGRRYTSSAFTKTESISCMIQNIGNRGLSNIKITYQINNSQLYTDSITSSLSSGATQLFTSSQKFDLSDSGLYIVKIWISHPFDSNLSNNYAEFRIKHLANIAPYLPIFEGFEAQNIQNITFKSPQELYKMGLSFNENIDFYSNHVSGRLRTNQNIDFAKTGYGCAILDNQLHPAPQMATNGMVFTYNLERYTKNKLYLDFSFAWHGGANDTANRVFIRGNDKNSWITLFNLDNNKNGKHLYANPYGICITDSLKKYGQALSTSTQIRFSQRGDEPTRLNQSYSKGYSFDDIKIYGDVNDLALIAIDSPKTGCGLGTNESIKVRLVNYGSDPRQNIPLVYQDNTGNFVWDTLYATLNPGDTASFTFKQKLWLTTPGNYTFKVYVLDAQSDWIQDDTLYKTITHLAKPNPVINPNMAQSLCEGDSVTLQLTNSFYKMLWNNGSNAQQITVNKTGNYSVLVENQNGCSTQSAPILVTVHPLPTPKILANPNDSFCAGDTINLTSNNVYPSMLWNGSQAQSYKVSQSGKFALFVTDSNGCSNLSDTLQTTQISINKPKLKVSGTDSILSDITQGKVQWYVNGNPVSIYTTYSIKTQTSGVYRVEAINDFGCSSLSDSLPFVFVSLNEVDKLSPMLLYPNPINKGSVLSIEGLSVNTPITIRDVSGKVIKELNTSHQREEIPINLPSGVYLVNIQSKSYKLVVLE